MRRTDNGFSLVELLVVIVVIGILSMVVTGFVLNGLVGNSRASARDTQQREVAQGLDLAANDIRISANADQNNRWPDANAPSGDQFGWASNGSTLVLATAAEDTSGNVIFSDAKNYITQKNNIVYFVNGGTLYKRTIAANVTGNAAKTSCPKAQASTSCPADKELLHNITAFGVSYLNGDNQAVTPTDARSIQLHVTVAKSVFKQTITTDYSTRMVFRND